MKIRQIPVAAAAILSAVTADGGDTLLAETAVACVYSADSLPRPRAVKTSEEHAMFAAGAWRVAWRAGETVEIVSPGGSRTRLGDGTAAGSAVFVPDVGGCWTFVNSVAGRAYLTLRHSLYGTEGAGTAEDPRRVTDEEEVAALGAASPAAGYHIALSGRPGLDLTALSLGGGLCLTGLGDGVWRVDVSADGRLVSSAPAAYRADARPSPRAVKTAEERAAVAAHWPVTRRSGETVTLVAPDGSSGSLAGTALDFTAGGVWTVVNSVQGRAMFTVRHSAAGTVFDGTAESPGRVVDGDELVDLAPGDGYVFMLDGTDGLLAELTVPDGFRLEALPDGLWRLAASDDGCLVVGPSTVYPADSRRRGPVRLTARRAALPVAYSGDDWLGDVTKASSLTFVSPSGRETAFDLTGTGAVRFTFDEDGAWRIRLAADGAAARETVVFIRCGFVLTVR